MIYTHANFYIKPSLKYTDIKKRGIAVLIISSPMPIIFDSTKAASIDLKALDNIVRYSEYII